jgi:HlyD family secretion protein
VKKPIWILVLVALAGAGAGGITYWKIKAAAPEAAQAAQTAKVERGSVRTVVACTGRVVSNLDVEIKCKASGEIMKLPFDVSDPVEKEALLVELDPVDEQRSLKKAEIALAASQAKLASAKQNLEIAQRTLATDTRRAQADLEAAQARFADARAKADRMKQLLEKKLGSQEDYDTAETTAVQLTATLKGAEVRLEEIRTQEAALEVKRQDVKLAEAQVDSDGIALQIAEDRVRDTKVKAPIQGVVTSRPVEIGQIISSGISNVGGGTTVMTLSDLSRIFVIASVDESDIGRVQLDLPAVVTADAFPGRKFQGRVVRIATRGANVSNVVTFEVKIEVEIERRTSRKGETPANAETERRGPRKPATPANAETDRRAPLKPEMTANVEIMISEKKDVLTVPVEAVSRKGGKAVVSVVGPGGAAEERVVETGISDGTKMEIVQGLSEGETVNVKKAGSESRWNSAKGRMGPPMF